MKKHVFPWQLTDAPSAYIDQQLKGIVIIELAITRLIGKWKVSQNQPDKNQQTLVTALKARATEPALAMASLIETQRNRH